MATFSDLNGQRYGAWTVLRLGEKILNGDRYWLCRAKLPAPGFAGSIVHRAADAGAFWGRG